MVTWAQIEAFAPELVAHAITADVQDLFFAAAEQLRTDFFGASLPLAQIYFVAHFATMFAAGAATAAGPVAAESAGGLSVQYGMSLTNAAAKSSFGSTAYGRAYLSLIAQYGNRVAMDVLNA